ncbi:hypothetical protein D1818_11110 [Aquimarina sp. BL5]|uniref:hypothetical protein n=1 Tax=Aquimarina sp. BL5 TaxID=1714860 RepID=UPI000E5196F3|nr:hypothetical protein [Aquimarina sp. BL5]AXT51355.1 hypothetical protein D1818_11110 [Aquimarina sp. BL5]RKN09855.1 hypothetical protein D7036_03540 [Aquimarina sp. BL5]
MDQSEKELEKQKKLLEIKEHQIKNKTIWLAILIPLIISLVSNIFSYINNEDSNKRIFTNNQISAFLESDEEYYEVRKKMKFLTDAGLLGEDSKGEILESLEKHLTSYSDHSEYFLQGDIQFMRALKYQNNDSLIKNKHVRDSVIYTNYKNAIKNFTKSIAINKNGYTTYNQLGTVYYNLALYSEYDYFYEDAIKYYDSSYAIKPRDNPIFYKALCLYQLGDCKKFNKLLKNKELRELSKKRKSLLKQYSEFCIN